MTATPDFRLSKLFQMRLSGQSERLQALRGLMLYGRLGASQEDPLPDFPLELNHQPNIYYMYIGNAP